MIRISEQLSIPEESLRFSAIRSGGPGGQHVNKVATGVCLVFDIMAAGLPQAHRERLMALNDRRISVRGLITIKAQRFKSQEQNRADGLTRLIKILGMAGREPVKRRATRPSKAARERRMDVKTRRGKIKTLRRKIDY